MWIKGAVWISVLVLMMIIYQRRHHARIQLLKGSKTVQARVRACRPVFKMIHPGLYQSITYHIELEWIEEGRWQTASIDLDHEIWPGHVLDLVSMADGQWQIQTSGVTRFPYHIYLLIGSLVFMMCLVDQLAQQWSGPAIVSFVFVGVAILLIGIAIWLIHLSLKLKRRWQAVGQAHVHAQYLGQVEVEEENGKSYHMLFSYRYGGDEHWFETPYTHPDKEKGIELLIDPQKEEAIENTLPTYRKAIFICMGMGLFFAILALVIGRLSS